MREELKVAMLSGDGLGMIGAKVRGVGFARYIV